MSKVVREKPTPRGMRTPITEAGEVISTACDVLIQSLGDLLSAQGQDPEAFFFEMLFKPKWDSSETDGDKEDEEFFAAMEKSPKETSSIALLHVASIATSYAVQAMKAEKDSREAWAFAASARYWAGILVATPFGEANSSQAAAQLARRRHAENDVLAREALAHWKQHIDPSLSAQKAATELVRVVPLSHKKLAEIISAAKQGRIEV